MKVNIPVYTERGKVFITEVFWDKMNAADLGYTKKCFHSSKWNIDIYKNVKHKETNLYCAIRKCPQDIFTKKIKDLYGDGEIITQRRRY